MTGSGTIRISGEVLRQALHMPDGTSLVGASMDTFRDELLLRVEHPDIPGRLDELNPTITLHVERHEWDWGVGTVTA